MDGENNKTTSPHTRKKKQAVPKYFLNQMYLRSFPESISGFQIYFELIRFYTKYTCRKTQISSRKELFNYLNFYFLAYSLLNPHL